ncbi:hypothetical protein [Saccharopolyspora pogona]|nr:hypothetical protein [Saccharopolyspora pogona]
MVAGLTAACPAFFISTRGTRLDAANMSHTFTRLLTTAGIAPIAGRPR